jgi:thiol-disulfide isomerase/thioredoxin
MPKAKGKPHSLHINSKSSTKSLDKVLSNGCGTVLVILASWCGACKRALPMWLKQLKKKNEKNVVLLDNELLPNTSLSSLNISHFPSTFEIPAGGKPVLLSNPQSEEDIKTLVNSNNESVDDESLDEESLDEESLDDESREKSNNQSGSLNPNDTRVVSASKFMNIVNSKNTLNSKNTVNAKKREEFPNTLSNFGTPKGFTPSMGKSLEKLKGGRRSRKIRKSRSRRAHKNTRKN